MSSAAGEHRLAQGPQSLADLFWITLNHIFLHFLVVNELKWISNKRMATVSHCNSNVVCFLPLVIAHLAIAHLAIGHFRIPKRRCILITLTVTSPNKNVQI